MEERLSCLFACLVMTACASEVIVIGGEGSDGSMTISSSTTSSGSIGEGGDGGSMETWYCEPWDEEEPDSGFGYKGCCGSFSAVQSASGLLPGTLFKGSGYKVYYLAIDGARYRFTSTMILDSWFAPIGADGIPVSDGSTCGLVVQVPDPVLVGIPNGDTVTFRPGVFITGLESDAARWVVSRGQIIRKLVPTSLQEQMYPDSWTERQRLSKDEFFVNYLMGEDVTDPSQYDPVAESETTIEQDLGLEP